MNRYRFDSNLVRDVKRRIIISYQRWYPAFARTSLSLRAFIEFDLQNPWEVNINVFFYVIMTWRYRMFSILYSHIIYDRFILFVQFDVTVRENKEVMNGCNSVKLHLPLSLKGSQNKIFVIGYY